MLAPDHGLRTLPGVVAIVVLTVVLTLTTVARLRHEALLRVHRLLGVVFALGAGHALQVGARRGASPWLRWYLVAVTLAGLAAWADRSGLGRTLAADRLGFLQAEDVRATSGDLARTHIFLCGPPQMIAALRGQFAEPGVPAERIHVEDFHLRARAAP